MSKNRVIVFTDHFRPARAAGGIITSLENLFSEIGKKENFIVISGNRDLGSKISIVKFVNRWYKQENVRVLYKLSIHNIFLIISIALNKKNKRFILPSFFSPLGTILPLITLRIRKMIYGETDVIIIIFARGQLFSNAFLVRSKKKNRYLKIAKLFSLLSGANLIYSSAYELEKSVLASKHFDLTETIIPDMLSNKFFYDNINVTHPSLTRNIDEDFINVLCVGRIHRIKRIHKVVHFLQNLNCALKIKINICGPIEDKNYWHEILSDLNNDKIVLNFMDTLNGEDLKSQYLKSDILCVFSKTENFSYVVPEALSLGCPVILTNGVYWSGFSSDCILCISENFNASDSLAATKYINSIYHNRFLYSQLSRSFLKFYISKHQAKYIFDFHRLLTVK
tara:strand:- start:512 stop:1696 length:1185 start_codon:yes stop_codon:yes gene_type:complete